MTQKMGYLIDLASLTFDSNGTVTSSWIQAMPLGKYKHPVYGDIDITPAKVTQFADNVTNRVRQTDLDIDYDHKEYGGEAAGWVKQAEARFHESDPKKNGLWILVEWTAKAWEAIKSKAYRYFSPEFDDEWTDPKTGVKYKDVLFGGGITNRPFLKDILPLNLSEKFSEFEGEESMTPEQIKELLILLGLDENASFDDLKAKLEELTKQPDPNQEPPKDEKKAEEPPKDGSAPMLSEDDVKKLSENPITAKLLSALESQSKQLEEQAKQFMEMKVNESVNKFSETAAKTGHGLTPNTKTALSEIFKAADDKTASLVTKLFENFLSGSAVVKLSEPVYRSVNDGNATAKKFSDRVQEIMTEQKLSYRDAAIAAARESEEDYDRYRNEGE